MMLQGWGRRNRPERPVAVPEVQETPLGALALVVAGTYTEAVQWARRDRLGREGRDWIYLDYDGDLAGYDPANGTEIHFVGTWGRDSHKLSLFQTASIMGFDIYET